MLFPTSEATMIFKANPEPHCPTDKITDMYRSLSVALGMVDGINGVDGHSTETAHQFALQIRTLCCELEALLEVADGNDSGGVDSALMRRLRVLDREIKMLLGNVEGLFAGKQFNRVDLGWAR
jgi:hypothetical protein